MLKIPPFNKHVTKEKRKEMWKGGMRGGPAISKGGYSTGGGYPKDGRHGTGVATWHEHGAW